MEDRPSGCSALTPQPIKEQDWSTWQWWAERYATMTRERIQFRYDGQKFVRL